MTAQTMYEKIWSDHVVAEDEGESLLYCDRGLVWYQKGRHDRAIADFNQAIKLDPNFAVGYRAVGDDYVNLGELGRASEYYAKAFELREHASEREKLIITADYYSDVTGELDKAAQAYQELIESYPRDGGTYNGLGVSVHLSAGAGIGPSKPGRMKARAAGKARSMRLRRRSRWTMMLRMESACVGR